MPKISVLMSAYNCGKYIEAAVRSVLEQTYRDLELLVVDDGSVDDTFTRLSAIVDPRLQVFRQANRGKSPTLNALLQKVRGEYVAIQDSDDLSEPSRLQDQLEQFEADPSLGVVMCGHSLIIEGKVVAPRAKYLSKEACRALIEKFRMPAHDPTMMFKADLGREIGFNEALYLGEGLDFILQMGEVSEIVVIGKPLYKYRIHSASITKRRSGDKGHQLLEVINKARTRRSLEPLTVEEFELEYGEYTRDKDNNLSGHFTDSAYQSVVSGQRTEALKTAFAAAQLLRNGFSYLKPLIYAVLPKFLVLRTRSRFGRE